MSYRLNPFRRQQQRNNIFEYAGQTATLQTWVSASAGIAAAGFGSSGYYANRTVTAIFGANRQKPMSNENQVAGGMIADGEFVVSLREPVGREDLLVWQGETYRVESDAVRNVIDNAWTVKVKRAST